jgi:hypothetical protein
MAKGTGSKVWARHLSNGFMVLVNQRLNAIIWLRDFHVCLSFDEFAQTSSR